MDVRVFLAHAIKLEAAAARASDDLADAMETWGNREVADFFRRMAGFSRRHLQDAMARAGFRHVSELPNSGYSWPDGIPPESAEWFGVDGFMDVRAAIELALAAERRGLEFYLNHARKSADPRVRLLAAEFAAEEKEHVAELERMAHDARL